MTRRRNDKPRWSMLRACFCLCAPTVKVGASAAIVLVRLEAPRCAHTPYIGWIHTAFKRVTGLVQEGGGQSRPVQRSPPAKPLQIRGVVTIAATSLAQHPDASSAEKVTHHNTRVNAFVSDMELCAVCSCVLYAAAVCDELHARYVAGREDGPCGRSASGRCSC